MFLKNEKDGKKIYNSWKTPISRHFFFGEYKCIFKMIRRLIVAFVKFVYIRVLTTYEREEQCLNLEV